MTEYDGELADTLGRAAAHEHAAGLFGDLIEDKLQGTFDGVDVAQYLPSLQEVNAHFTEYTGMIDEMGRDANNHVPSGLADTYREMIPAGSASAEYGLAAGYFLERKAREMARESWEAAEGTEYAFFVDSLQAIGREENQEMRDIEEILKQEYDWDERDDVSFDELTSVDNVNALKGRL